MTRAHTLAIAAAATLLGAWSPWPDAPEITSTKAEVLTYLRDPASVQWGKVWAPRKGVVCGTFNGRNAFGAYAGETRFVRDDGSLYILDSRATLGHATWSSLCT